MPEPPQRAPRRNERDPLVLAFVLHQFPIGHMPVAASRPSGQVAPAEAEAEAHRSGRFAPQDHPQADLVDDTDALARVRSGESGGLEREEPGSVPEDVIGAHDPLGELSEIEWEHKYQVRDGEYAWPPTGEHPEGGVAEAEPVVLEPDTVVDRIGDGEGRMLAALGTSFSQRCLPPEHLERAYRRYRVMRRLPVWQIATAPWFAQPGGGIRYRATYPLDDLVSLGYLVELTRQREAAEAQTLRIDREQATAEEAAK
ncbi:hypothetical protein GCM10010470_59900 [Saccharopolyspora taberi]|uniref:TNT domain-containing protein n=2 Tax=Saccharopolyspora taberi TaxID=60895 RepID=A0ABN3VLH1_9PSEU